MPAIFKADLICLMAPQYLDPGDDDDRIATTSDGGGVDRLTGCLWAEHVWTRT